MDSVGITRLGSPLSLPQLSLVIPALSTLDALETTLVSVLQNRPQDCEVVVVLNRAYDDPYSLSGEVRFLVVREAQSLAQSLSAAVQACRGMVVHVLAAGVEVDEGWTDAAMEHFIDNRVAAVAPLVLAERDDVTICAAGLGYSCGGRRSVLAEGSDAETLAAKAVDVLGPTHFAAFYRRESLLKLAQAFDPAVGDERIDVDTALQLKQAGYRAVLEPRSRAYRGGAEMPRASAFAAGRGAERLFWRNVSAFGRARSLLTHPFTLLSELFAARSFGEKCGGLLGRLAAVADVVSLRRHQRRLAEVGQPGLAFVVTSTGDRIRIDAAHPHPASTVKPKQPAERRYDGESGGRAA